MDANGEARWLTRRLLRRRPRRVAARWAALGSVWVHLALLVLAVGLPGPRPGPPPPPPEPPTSAPMVLEIRFLPPPPAIEPSLEPGAPEVGGSVGRRAAPPSVEAVAEAVAEAVERVASEVQVELRPPERRRVLPPSEEDPVEELRRSLGIGPIEGPEAPRDTSALAAWVGDLGPGVAADRGEGNEPSYPSAAGLGGTPLGEYIREVEALVFERWRSSDLQVHSRAIGLQGNVTVRYAILRDGSVTRLRISRASGLPEIDALAVRAIPRKLPRLPGELGLRELEHEITFRYRNPP